MVGVLARFEFLAGHEEEVGRFFAEGRTIVEGQPASTGWYAARLGPSTYTAFAVFANEADRDALLAAGGPVLSKTYGHLSRVRAGRVLSQRFPAWSAPS